MESTIDAAGRVVIPKALRDALGLAGGDAIQLVLRNGVIEIEKRPVRWHLERRGRRRAAVPDQPVPPVTADTVRDVLERVRRREP